MENKEYGNDSIRSLSDREAVRMRVSTYAGGSDKLGAFTTVREVISNGVDEFKTGNGKEIEVIYNEDRSITVIDTGRGVPMGWNESEQKNNYELIFFELNAGGKYSSDSYEYSIGLNGIGSSLVTLSSEYADVQSVRDGFVYNIHSEKGIIVGEMKKEENIEGLPNGTKVTWKPDLEVFDEIDFPEDWFINYMEQQAVVNKGLKMTFESKLSGELSVFEYENGITDYAKEISDDKNFTDFQYFDTDDLMGKDREDRKEYKSKYEVVFSFNNDKPIIQSYHNSSYLSEGGSPHDAIKSAFVFAIDKQIRLLDKYNKNEKKVSFDDIKESLAIITNTYSTETAYKNQTKLAISNKFIKDKLNDLLRDNLHVYFIENPKDAEKIVTQVLANKRSRERAEKSRLDIRKKLSGEVNNITGRVDGFFDARTKDPKEAEFYIVEGKSANGAIIQGRNSQFQSTYAIRGKILSCLKASNERIFSNDVITSIYKILGCGVELKGDKKGSNFDLSSLRFDKIIIASDSDVDGYSIRTLLLTMFYVLSPTLLEEGKVFVVEAPLYEVYDEKKDEIYYAHNELERERVIEEHKLTKYKISRNKGLGEMDNEGVAKTLMNPESRRLVQISVDDAEKMAEMFELFMGDDVIQRRNYIEKHFDEYEFEV